MLCIQLLLALFFLLFAKPASCETEDSDFLILRSKSYNTISQLELFDKHHYSIFDIKKGNSLVDFNIEIKKTNITALSESIDPVTYTTNQLKIMSFFIGRLQKKRVSAILTHNLFEIRNIMVKDTSQPYLLKIELQSKDNQLNYELLCNETSKYACQFTDMEHGLLENTVFVIIQLKRCPYRGTVLDSNNVEYYYLILKLKSVSTDLKVDYAVQYFRIDPLLDSSNKYCKQDQMAILDNYDTSNRSSILIARFCPINPNNLQETNQLTIEELVKDKDWYLTKETPKIFTSYSYLNHNGTSNSYFRLLKLVPSLNFTVIATAEHIITIRICELRTALNSSDHHMVLPVSIVIRMDISNIFCNFINIRELCCTSKIRNEQSNNTLEVYKLLEFLVLENALIPIVIPIKIESNFNLLFSLNTKNYIVLQFKDSLYFCYRRENNDYFIDDPQKNSSKKQEDDKPTCSKVEVSENYIVAYIKKLLYEENYSNPIDGYVAVALVDKEELKKPKPQGMLKYEVQPMLITGPYFTFTLDMKLNQFVCNRYFRNCAFTNITFIETGQNQITNHIKSVYIVDEAFNSVISLQKDMKNVHLKNNGKLAMRISDHYYGDVIRPRVFRDVNNKSQDSFVGPSSNQEFYATTPKPFRYVLKENMAGQLTAGFNSSVDWAYIKINSDKTINVAVTFSHFFRNRMRQKVFKTSMAIDLDPANKTYTKKILTESFRVDNNRYVLPVHSVDKDTVYMVTIDLQSDNSNWELVLVLRRFKGGEYIFDKNSAESISINQNERLLRVRTALDRDKDLIALISNMAIYIRRVEIGNDKSQFPAAMTIPFKDFLKNVGESNISVVEVYDILAVKNIMIIDLRVCIAGEPTDAEPLRYEKRIYIYNLDLERSFFYSYGFIQIKEDLSTTEYSVYYSKEVDKAILIYKNNATIIEYSLDNIFLDMTKLSREIQEDTRTVLKTYGDFKVIKVINMNPLSEEYGMNRTLFLPFEERYMIALEVENIDGSKRRGLMLLMGHITEQALSVFKSIVTTMPANRVLVYPEIMSEVPSEVIPIFFLSTDFTTLEIQFLWLEEFINFNYQMIFAGVTNSSNDMALNLRFRDPNGNYYENVLNISRDSRFHISGDNLTMDLKEQKMNLSFESYGIVSKYGLICPVNNNSDPSVKASKEDPKGLLTRNRTIYLFCEYPSLNATLVPGVMKESILEMNFTDWKEPIDLLQVAEPSDARFRNYFTVLEKERLLIFKTDKSVIRLFILMKSGDITHKLSDCIFIKSFTIEKTGIWVILFCSDKASFKEYRYEFNLSHIEEFEKSGNLISEMNKKATTPDYIVPERIWRSINKDKSNFKIINNLAFCKSDINLLSIGSKTTIDVFLHRQLAAGDTERYMLVNSTMSDKYSEFEIINFKVYHHKMYHKTNDSTDFYKFVQVNYNQKKKELQLEHNALRFNSPNDVVSTLNTAIKLDDLNIEGKLLGVDILSEKDTFVVVDGEEKVRFVYRIYIVEEKYIYEIKLTELYIMGDEPVSPELEPFTETFNYRKFTFAGLCDFDSSFRMCRTTELLMVDCIPKSFDSIIHSIILYRLPPDNETPEIINPSFSIPQQSGYNEKNSNQLLVTGDDNVTRILKTSPRGIVDLYRVNPSLTLHVSVDTQLFSNSSLNLKLANEFEHFEIKISFKNYSFKYLKNLFRKIADEYAFICIITIFWILICVMYWMKPILKKCKKLKRYARLCFKKSPQLTDPVKSLRDTLQKLVPKNQREAERLRAMLEQAVNAGYIPVEDDEEDEVAKEAEAQRKAMQAISTSFFEEIYG